jgi:hypothetical protein
MCIPSSVPVDALLDVLGSLTGAELDDAEIGEAVDVEPIRPSAFSRLRQPQPDSLRRAVMLPEPLLPLELSWKRKNGFRVSRSFACG